VIEIKSIRNEQGAATLTYVMMIFAVLIILSPVILMTATTSSDNTIRRNNEKIANYLATSGMETFIAYLDTYNARSANSCDKDRDCFLNKYSGFVENEVSISLPEGTSASYKLQKIGPVNKLYTITISTSAGTGKFRVTPAPLIYKITADSAVGTTIDTSNRTDVPPGTNEIYIQGTATGVPNTVEKKTDTGLNSAIAKAIDEYTITVTKAVNDYDNEAVACVCSNESAITSAINNSTRNPVILKITSSNVTMAANSPPWGTASKPVVLIFNNLTLNGTSSLNITGELIVKNNVSINGSSSVSVNQAGSNYGNLYILRAFTANTFGAIQVSKTLYAESISLAGGTYLKAGQLIIDKIYARSGAGYTASSSDILAGSINVSGLGALVAVGDIFVEQNYTSSGNNGLIAGGRVAVGGDFTDSGYSVIYTGGGKTSLVLGSNGGSGGSGTKWNPTPQ
jgi:hypothetical protein